MSDNRFEEKHIGWSCSDVRNRKLLVPMPFKMRFNLIKSKLIDAKRKTDE